LRTKIPEDSKVDLEVIVTIRSSVHNMNSLYSVINNIATALETYHLSVVEKEEKTTSTFEKNLRSIRVVYIEDFI